MLETLPAIPRDPSGLPDGRTRMHAPDSVTRRIAGDVRNVLMSGSVFTLQVAHPIVGAGVHEHSAYREDPWTRLRDIDASGRRFLWTDEAAAREEGARLRRIHREIQGVDAKGVRYHSLDPHGYGWVHWVFLDSMRRSARLFGISLSSEDEARLFLEWYEAALFLGLRDAHLPKSLAEYEATFERKVRTELEYNPVVANLLGDRRGPPPPPAARSLPPALWSALIGPMHGGSRWLALACLPPAYRERIAEHHPWTAHDEAKLARLGDWVAHVVPRLPDSLRRIPDARRVDRERIAS